MRAKIKTYNSEDFRQEYFNNDSELNRLFEKSIADFFCLRIEDLISGVLKPIAPSREESHTLIFVTYSSYKTEIDFKGYEIRANQILTIQAGAVFSVDEIIGNVRGYVCHFHPNTLIGLFGNRSLISEFEFLNTGNYPVIDLKESARIAVVNLFERMVSEFKSEGHPNSSIIHSYLYALLTELKILYGKEYISSLSASYRLLSKLRMLAHQKVKENLKVADFASIMNVSPNHLNKAVKSITSKKASEIIDEIKLIEIKYLLYQSNLSISEISYQMGYLDPSYFTRFFKKREKISPTDFRKMIEKS